MRITIVLMTALGMIGSWTLVRGETVTYSFSGRVTASYWSLLDGLPILQEDGVAWLPEVDDEVLGRITIDTSLPLLRPYTPPDMPPWLPFGGTFVAPSAVEVTIDGHRWSSSQLGISVHDDRQLLDGSVVDDINFGTFSMLSAELPLDHFSLALSPRYMGADVYRNGEWNRDLTLADMESGDRTNMLAFAATGPPLWFSIESWGRVANRLIGDFNGDATLTVADVNELLRQTRLTTGRFAPDFDFTGDGTADAWDIRQMIHSVFGSFVGDANLDRSFDSSDLLMVLQTNQYEDGVLHNSDWSTGDWNGDSEFDGSDLVAAFQDGGYEAGPRAAAVVPEPSGIVLTGLGVMSLVFVSRRNDSRQGPLSV